MFMPLPHILFVTNFYLGIVDSHTHLWFKWHTQQGDFEKKRSQYLEMTMMQGKQGFSKHKTIMIGVQVFIAALAAETDKDIKHLVYNPVGQQCSD